MSQTSFIDALLPAGFGRNERLERIAGLIDWGRLEALLGRVRAGANGRPTYEAQTPDETTLCRFRNALKDADLGEALFAEVARQLDAAGFMLKTGKLIDATLVQCAVRPPPPGSTPKDQESRSALDPDANWTRRGASRSLFFGYKAHIGVDRGSGLIRSRILTPAKIYESVVADGLIVGDEKAVYADKAYEKKERRAALRARGVKDRIQHRRHKGLKALPHWQSVRNKLIGRVRGAVERTFSILKGRYGFTRMRYRGLKANAFHLDLAAIAHNLRTAAAIAT